MSSRISKGARQRGDRAPSQRAALRFASIRIDPDSALSLQAQIRGHLVRAIHSGDVPPGARLPGSRQLAIRLGVSRNTVAIAYQQLLAEGLIVARERSGMFVPDEIRMDGVGLAEVTRSPERATSTLSWSARISRPVGVVAGFRGPADWQRYSYPFLGGRFESSLYLVNEWREAARLALGVRDMLHWSVDAGESDDAFLVDEIRTKILPRRGIHVRPEEIMITAGAQQGLYALVQLLVDSRTVAAVEEPGDPDLRHLLRLRGATLVNQPVDLEGMRVDAGLDRCGIAFATPGQQLPTGAVMARARRRALLALAAERDMVVVEHETALDTSYGRGAQAALKSEDREGRVIYVAGLSNLLAPALRLGFIVAAPELLDELRKLRRLMSRHPPLSNQRTAAYLLSLGHFDANMLRVGRACQARVRALVDALDYYLPHLVALEVPAGALSFLVRGPDDLDVHHMASEAAKRGVLIEPADAYFADREAAGNVFRMGVTSIPLEKIRRGVQTLSEVVRDLRRDKIETVGEAAGEWLIGDALRASLENATYLCRTVHGEPYSIQLLADGTLIGEGGYASEDRDTGEWWIEDDRWVRRWTRWSYGEAQAFHVVVDGDQVKWFGSQGQLVDRALIAPERADSDAADEA